MESEISWKWSVLAISIVAVVSVSAMFFFGGERSGNIIPIIPVATATIPKERVITNPPVRLKIPAIQVDSVIERVGLASDGTMAVPKGPNDVAWYEFGPLPGQEGSAVMAGHYGWKDGVQAVFDNLYTLHKGDRLYVEGKDGKITTFVVQKIRIYSQKEDASDVFVSNDGKAHLNLITCEGVWSATEKSYSGRLIVFTNKE